MGFVVIVKSTKHAVARACGQDDEATKDPRMPALLVNGGLPCAGCIRMRTEEEGQLQALRRRGGNKTALVKENRGY